MTRSPPTSLPIALTLVLAGAAAVGVAEGGIDILREALPSERRRAFSLLAYAVATWLVPFAVIVVPLSLAVRGVARERLSAVACVALGVGAWGSVAAWVDGRHAVVALVIGIALGLVMRAVFVAVEALGARRVTTLTVVAVVAAAFGVGFTAHESMPAPPPTGDRPPLIILNIDTLRRDALSIHGAPINTPHIDRVGREGWAVDDVLAPAGWTLPSVTSLWSGTTPRIHGVRSKSSTLPDDIALLPEHLAAHDYATAAVFANPILAPDRGFARGFEHLDDHSHQVEKNFFWVVRLHRFLARVGWRASDGSPSTRKMPLPSWNARDGFVLRHTGYLAADEVTDAGIAWLDHAQGSNVFLYLHYYDPHDPYLPHPATLAYRDPPFDGAHVDEQIDLYRHEVTFLDEHVGRLLDALEERDLLERAIVVVTSDHGEEFLDHGRWFHGHSLYDELVRVPLLIRWPDDVDAGPTPPSASVIDIAPTILDALDIDPMPGTMGRSLLDAFDETRPHFAEHVDDQQWQIAARLGGQHWMISLPEGLDVEDHEVTALAQQLDTPPSPLRRWTFDASIDTFANATRDGATWNDGALEIDATLTMPLATRPWTSDTDGLMAVTWDIETRGAGDNRLVMRVDRREGDAWRSIATSKITRRTPGAPLVVRAQEGDTWRLVVTQPNATPSQLVWRLDDVTVSTNDPHRAFAIEGFDIATDPQQQRNLAGIPGLRAAREHALKRLLDYATSPTRTSERELTPDEIERLRELGYMK